MKSITRRITYALTVLFAFASLPLQAAESLPLERYHYGMQLDVQKVLALHEESFQWCQVVDARMDYLDSRGQKRSLAYRKHASSCSEGN
jgi:hypothetical protein